MMIQNNYSTMLKNTKKQTCKKHFFPFMFFYFFNLSTLFLFFALVSHTMTDSSSLASSILPAYPAAGSDSGTLREREENEENDVKEERENEDGVPEIRKIRSISFNNVPGVTVYDLICVDNPLLRAVQLSSLVHDCKEFVDRPLLKPAPVVFQEFNELPDHSPETLAAFLDSNFGETGDDLDLWTPPDCPKIENTSTLKSRFALLLSFALSPSASVNSSTVASVSQHPPDGAPPPFLHMSSASAAIPFSSPPPLSHMQSSPHLAHMQSSPAFAHMHSAFHRLPTSSNGETPAPPSSASSWPIPIDRLSNYDIQLLKKSFHLWSVLGRKSKHYRDDGFAMSGMSVVRNELNEAVFILEEAVVEERELTEDKLKELLSDDIPEELLGMYDMTEKNNTFIDVPYGFIIPGGRFREAYYWDSYWIIRGLIISKMYETAKGMIRNFCFLIDKFGFIPNGLRLYYLDRSQPPVLSLMVNDYIVATRDYYFLVEVYPFVEKEYHFWMKKKNKRVAYFVSDHHGDLKPISYEDYETYFRMRSFRKKSDTMDTQEQPDGIKDKEREKEEEEQKERNKQKQSIIYTLNRFGSASVEPRPESYREDYILKNLFSSPERQDYALKATRAAAESGWDFSSRWFNPENCDINNATSFQRENMQHMDTMNVVPVDLNTMLYGTELQLAKWAWVVYIDDAKLAKKTYQRYSNAANRRKYAMKKLMYNPQTAMWVDYYLRERRQSDIIGSSSVWPLYIRLEDDDNEKEFTRSVKAFVFNSTLWGKYGLMASAIDSGEQWDYKNVWPPVLHVAVHVGLIANDEDVKRRAITMVENFLSSVYQGYWSYGVFFEKYNSEVEGMAGAGGEYDVQIGFGWTIAVVLEFLKYKSAGYEFYNVTNVLVT